MALVLKDRVKEQTTTTGTGTVTLGGAVSGFDTFASVGDGNTTYYAIVSQSANEWEVGLGTYTASGTTLSRDTILESSNSDAAVNFSAGTKDVFVTYPADKSVYADAAGTVNAGAIAATSLTLTTDLAVADGGTGAGTASAARTNLGAAASGSNSDITALTGLTTDIAVADGGTGAGTASAARTNLGAAASGSNSDITALTGLTTDLTVAQGGTGAGTFAANGILFGNGTSAIGATAVGTATHVLTSNGAGVAPTFQAAAAGGATDIDGLSDGMTSAAGKNLSLGTDALAALGTSDLSSTAVGYKAGEAVTSGRGTFVGHLAGADLNSWSNTVVGAYSAQSHTGMYNTLVGAEVASAAAGLMEFNTIVGANAGDNITTGGNSTIVGYTAGAAITSAGSHALVGFQSGNAITTGNFHTALGRQANTTSTTGQQTVVIGYNAQPSSATASHEITLGNASVTKFRIPGINWSIKDTTATENYVLTVDAAGEAGWEAAAGGIDVYCGGSVFEGTTTISRATWTTVTMTETADSGTVYDGTTFTVPSGEGGVYQLLGYVTGSYTAIGNDGEAEYIRFLKNGSTALATNGQLRLTHSERYGAISTDFIGSLSAGDTIVVQAVFNDGDGSGNAAIIYAGFVAIKVA